MMLVNQLFHTDAELLSVKNSINHLLLQEMMSERLVLFKYQQQFRLNICPVISVTHSHWENWFVLVALKIKTNLFDLYFRETRARHQMQFVFGAVWWMKPAAT